MIDTTISIFGNKIFSEILHEIKLFTNYKVKYYEDLNLCLKDAKDQNLLTIFFEQNQNINYLSNIKINNFPYIIITSFSILKDKFLNEISEQLVMPFSILEFEKKVILLAAKNEFKKNSLIKLGEYTINKNERKIIKNNLELKLSEKEINFLILFTKNKKPIGRNIVLKNVWKYSSESETHTIETHIHRLRKKILEKFGDKNFVKNNNEGYYI